MIKVAAGIIVVLIIMNAMTGFMLRGAWKDVATLESNVKVAEQALVDQREALAAMKANYEAEQVKVLALGNSNNDIAVKRDEAVNKLNSFRGRLLKAAEGRPTLVGKLATRATKRAMCEMYKATGGEGGPCD